MPIEALATELTSQRPQWRVYNFWATWCAPCLAEMPGLKKFADTNPNVDMVFINVDHPGIHGTRVRKVIERMDLGDFEHLALLDDDPAMALHRIPKWPDSIPVTLVVSPAGERTRQYNVPVEPATLERALKP